MYHFKYKDNVCEIGLMMIRSYSVMNENRAGKALYWE